MQQSIMRSGNQAGSAQVQASAQPGGQPAPIDAQGRRVRFQLESNGSSPSTDNADDTVDSASASVAIAKEVESYLDSEWLSGGLGQATFAHLSVHGDDMAYLIGEDE